MGFQDDNISAEIHDADILPMSGNSSCRRGLADSPRPKRCPIWKGDMIRLMMEEIRHAPGEVGS